MDADSALAAQMMTCELTDDPGRFREPPLSGIFRHAQREWERSRGGNGGIMDVPF